MSDSRGSALVLPLDDPSANLRLVGGKGASLAQLAAAGLPVPGGFHITTEAYRHFVSAHGLRDRILAAVALVRPDTPATFEMAAEQISDLFAERKISAATADVIRSAYATIGGGEPAVAVRSSATAEDLPGMSFAGQHETYLNVRGDTALVDAVRRCWASLWTARAIGYRARNGINQADVALAVVVQELVAADAAGVLFTAGPVTGSRDRMVLNAAWGLGEAVVSGKVTPDTVVVDVRTGAIVEQQIGDKSVMTVRAKDGTAEQPVPPERRRIAVLSAPQVAELAGIGRRITDLSERPMDIEWATHDGTFFVLQARPVTAVPTSDSDEWNDSLAGDYLWSNGNFGEAIPDVMTPCTWSLVQLYIPHVMAKASLPDYRGYGMVGGRLYLNLSLSASVAAAVGINRQRFAERAEQTIGKLPDGMEIPLIPLPRWRALRQVVPVSFRVLRRVRANTKVMAEFVTECPQRCATLRDRFAQLSNAPELRALWNTEVEPLFYAASDMLEAAVRRDWRVMSTVQRRLRRLVGEADGSALMSGLNAGGEALASLGPLLGLAHLARGEIDRDTYVRNYGHRSPHEFEVSMPRPAEQPSWLDRQLAGTAGQDPILLLARQEAARSAAWDRLAQCHPGKVTSTRRMLDRWARAARNREQARSELIRVFWVLRAFVLRAGELTECGADLFFCSIDEILTLLDGDQTPLAAVATRKAIYRRYRSLPAYPCLIRGRFDPFRWATDPNRRGDLYDERGESTPVAETVTGFPGAAGVVEGIARVMATADEGDQLQAGEILVTTVTNIGWTPLFPRAAAVVTDVGAPLSHAAIVARELGIPAVVGCRNATMRLHTGDRIRVDGERGTVEVLKPGLLDLDEERGRLAH